MNDRCAHQIIAQEEKKGKDKKRNQMDNSIYIHKGICSICKLEKKHGQFFDWVCYCLAVTGVFFMLLHNVVL